MKITLTTRTPVHIGTGLTYSPNEYIISKRRNNEFVIRRIDHSLFGKYFSQSQREEFLRRIDNATAEKPFRLTTFMQEQNIDPYPLTLYRLSNNSGEREPNEIRECIKTGGTPYIPGSSIKGALRTALLWWYAKDDPNFIDYIRSDLQDSKRRHEKEIGNKYVASVFSLRPEERGQYDPKYDLLRFLQVSDCMPVNHDLSVEGIRTYSLRNNTLLEKDYILFAECVRGTFSGSIGGLDQIQRLGNSKELPLLSRKISLLGMRDPGDVKKVAPHLNKVLTEWNRWCLDKEKRIVSKELNSQFFESLDNVKTWLKESAHIRLGFAVGTLYQTLIALLEEKDTDLAARIINSSHAGKKITRKTIGDTLEPPYPKSLEFTQSDEPMGWISIKMDNL